MNTVDQLRNQPLRIGVIDDPPFTSACTFEPECAYRGSGVETATIVCQYLGLDCRFLRFDSYAYGTGFENGTGSGVIGAVVRGEFDTHLPNVMPSYVRSYAVDFSHGYYYAESILVTRATASQADLGWSLVYAFHWRVWCLFAFALVSTAVVITCFLHEALASPKYWTRRPGQVVLHLLETCVRLALVAEHRHSFFKHRPTLILSVIWGFCIVVLSSAYSGFLFSNKVVVDNSAPFTDFEGFVTCVESGRCSVVTPTLAISYMQFLIAPDSPHGPRLARAFDSNPVRVIEKDSIPAEILRERDVYLTWATARNDLPGHIDETNRCSYFIIPTPETTIGGFITRKGERQLREALDLMSSVIREHGMEFATGLETMDKGCMDSLASYEARLANQKMSFDKALRIPFYFFLAGLGGACLVFLVERFGEARVV